MCISRRKCYKEKKKRKEKRLVEGSPAQMHMLNTTLHVFEIKRSISIYICLVKKASSD